MRTLDDIRAWLSGVTYWPNYAFEAYETAVQGVWLAISYQAPDSTDPFGGELKDMRVKSEIPLPLIHNQGDFYTWLRWRLEIIARHEVHEGFRVFGEQPWDPHDEAATDPPLYGGTEEIGSGEVEVIEPSERLHEAGHLAG